jgi:chromosome segregation ATPase
LVYQTELNSLLADTTVVETTSSTQAAADIQASIEATELHWNTRIDEIAIKIAILQNELIVGSSADDSVDSRINSLRLQAAEMEKELNAKIANLETTVNELYNQANNSNGSDSGQAAEIQRQIDALNDQLEDIWTKQSSNGLEILIQVQALEKQVRVLEEEREEEQYRLEEELWDLDSLLQDFYNGQNSDYKVKELEYQAIADGLNLRRLEVDELRWTIGIEQQDAWDELNASQNEAGEQIKLIEQEQLGAIKSQIREIEDSLQGFYDQRRDLENDLREAQRLVDQKQRELEDKVFDALESAAGTVDEAGNTVLTATEESGTEIAEDGVSADGTAN